MMFTDLPRDIESEILSRVPATSLKELQTTCKRWYALFKDSSFVKQNSSQAATQVILRDEFTGYSVTTINTLIHSINLCGFENSFDPSIGVARKLNMLKQLKISEIFHCEGLLLCTTSDKGLVVWNPCTGQTKWIQSSYHKYHKYVLGYKNNNNDSCDSYKILTFDYLRKYQKVSPLKFEIYDFNSNSWRILDEVSPNFFIASNKGVTLKGNTYWFALDEQDRHVKFVLKFNFTTERFRRLSIPYQSGYYVDEFVILSVVREERLALLQRRFDKDSIKIKIWMTKAKIDEDNDLSWSNLLVVDNDSVMSSACVILYMMAFLVDEENKMVVCCELELNRGRTRIYIARDGKLVHQNIAHDIWPSLVTYVPSLVKIQ